MFIKSIKGSLALVLFLCLLGCGFSSLGAMRSSDLFGGDRSYGTIAQIQALQAVNEEIKGLKEAKKVIEDKIKNDPKNKDIGDSALEDLCKKDPLYVSYCNQLKKLVGGGNWKAMLGQELSVRFARSLGDVIDGRVKSTGDRLVVPAWEAIIDGILKVWQKSVSVLFHQSKDPFTKQELERWSNIIVSDLNGFGVLIKGREAFDSRSKDLTGRAFESETEVAVNQDQLLNELIIKRYAEQFENYAGEIELRKGYYKNNREVVFISNQIIKWLLDFRQIILSIKSIKDVAAKFGQNISVITEMQKNIKNLFEELTRAVAPASSLDPKKRTSYSDSQQRPSYPMSYGNNYADSDWNS